MVCRLLRSCGVQVVNAQERSYGVQVNNIVHSSCVTNAAVAGTLRGLFWKTTAQDLEIARALQACDCFRGLV